MRLGLLVCAFALLVPRTAEAQTASLTIKLASITDPDGTVRSTPEDIAGGVNQADCENPAATVLEFSSTASPTMGRFDLWISQNNNCVASTTRVGTTQICFDIGKQITTLESNMLFSVTLAELTHDSLDPCADITSNAGGTVYLHVFDSTSDNTIGDLTGPYGVATIPVDVVAPIAPTMTSGNMSGEGDLRVTWDVPDGDSDEQQYEYEVFNVGACGGGDGGTTGDAAVAGDGGAAGTGTSLGITGDAFKLISPAGLGLPVGSGVLIAVQAIDPADNRSALSAPICLTHVPTFGFCETAGECSGSCSCSIAPGSGPSRPLAALAGFAATLGLVVHRARRRERNRRSRA